ncbi:MAG TPA: hypothetical protein VNF26_05600 [Candidatus Baltobacterales bacterium]|nr:hypothetical protein [Candidatus Baltobacterales bacterium]
MTLKRSGVVLGLVAGALAVGALAGGAGSALATAGRTNVVAAAASPTPLMSSITPGHFGGMFGMAFGQNSPIAAGASYLGLSQADLQAQLQSGKSLAQLAQARGKSVSGLEDAIVAAITKNLNADSALSADQKTAILTQVKSHLDTMVNTTHLAGLGFGPMGAGMSGMMGR